MGGAARTVEVAAAPVLAQRAEGTRTLQATRPGPKGKHSEAGANGAAAILGTGSFAAVYRAQGRYGGASGN